MTQLRVVSDERKREKGTAEPGLVDPEAERLGDPAAADRAGDGGGRAVRDAVSAPDEGQNEPAFGPDYAAGAGPTYFNYRKVSIYGGSNEIQRNIIAKAILGL